MKKYLPLLSIPALMALNSCMQEDIVKNGGQEVTAKVSITLPGNGAQSRTGDADASDTNDPENPVLTSNMRLFIFVYQGKKIVDVIERDVDFSTTNSFIEDIRLVTGQPYTIAAWADYDNETTPSYYNVNQDNGTVELIDTDKNSADIIDRKGNDTKNDAFFATIDKTLENNETISLTLKRPFGLVQVTTNDWSEGTVVNAGFRPEKYTCTISVPTKLTLRDGALGEKENVVFSGSISNTEESYTETSNKLSFDYIFANDKAQTVLDKFTTSYLKESEEICSYEFNSIPVQANYITNISGNVLTKNGKVDIKIEQAWNDGDITVIEEVKTASELAEIINNISADNNKEVVIKLSENIQLPELNKPFVTILGPNAGKNPNEPSQSLSRTTSTDNTNSGISGIIKISAGNIVLDGLDFNNASIVNNGKVENLTVRNCSFTNSAQDRNAPIYISGSNERSNNITVENNRFEDINVTNSSAVIIWYADNVTVRGNYIDGTNYHGIQFNSNNNILVEGNSIKNAPNCGIQVADYAEGKIIIKGNTLNECNTAYFTDNSKDYFGAIRVYSSKDGIKDIELEITNNTISANNGHRGIYVYNRKEINDIYVDNTPEEWTDKISENTITGFSIETEIGYPKVAASNGKYYSTIAEAIADLESGATILLSSATFDEVINIGKSDKVLTIVGQEGTKVKSCYLNGGNTTFENIEFYGQGMSAGSYSTVFAGGSATVNLKDCVVNVTEETNGRPVETAYNAAVNFTMEGCTITAGSAKNSYLNPVAKNGSLTIKNCTFVDKGLTAEFNIDANSAKVLPVIEGNNFGGNSVGFSYYADPTISDASGLDFVTKMFCNNILNNNTFTGSNKVKVTPLPWVSGVYFWVNTPFEFATGTVIYENSLTANIGDWNNATFENGETIINNGSFSKSGEYRSQWLGNWTQSLDIYIDNNTWQNGNYICLVSSATSTTGEHAGQDQDLAILKYEGKYLMKLTSSTSGSGWNGSYTNASDRKTVELESMNGWYTITWKYYRTDDGASKCNMFVTKESSSDKLNEFTFNIPQEIGLNRYIWLTSEESDPTKIMPLKVRNQKIVLD